MKRSKTEQLWDHEFDRVTYIVAWYLKNTSKPKSRRKPRKKRKAKK